MFLKLIKTPFLLLLFVLICCFCIGSFFASAKEKEAKRDTSFSAKKQPSASWNFFNDKSPWNQNHNFKKAKHSQTMINKMLAVGGPAVETKKSNQNWGTPIYYGRKSDPLFRVLVEANQDYSQDVNNKRIHFPRKANQSQGSDGVIWVYDQPSGFTYMLQQTQINKKQKVLHAWKGYRLKAKGRGFRFATGPPTGVQPIRPEELAQGRVNHTISLSVRCLSGRPVKPFANSLTIGKTCSTDKNPNRTLSMGNVIYLNMSAKKISNLNIPRWQKAILRGLKNHGALVGLNGGASWAFKFENRLGRTSFGIKDPYQKYKLPETLDFSDALQGAGGWKKNLEVARPFSRYK